MLVCQHCPWYQMSCVGITSGPKLRLFRIEPFEYFFNLLSLELDVSHTGGVRTRVVSQDSDSSCVVISNHTSTPTMLHYFNRSPESLNIQCITIHVADNQLHLRKSLHLWQPPFWKSLKCMKIGGNCCRLLIWRVSAKLLQLQDA